MRRKRHDLFLDKEFPELPESEFVIPLDSEDSDSVTEPSLVSTCPEKSFEDSEKLAREESMLDRDFPEEKKFLVGSVLMRFMMMMMQFAAIHVANGIIVNVYLYQKYNSVN